MFSTGLVIDFSCFDFLMRSSRAIGFFES